MADLILDTGPLVALLDRSEQQHDKCVDFFRIFRGRIWTTEAVLTESLWLLASHQEAMQACLEVFTRGAVTLVPQSVESLARIARLMAKYRDVPMDFADATLVALAEETDVQEIFTLDRRGFSVYRIKGRKAFTIRP